MRFASINRHSRSTPYFVASLKVSITLTFDRFKPRFDEAHEALVFVGFVVIAAMGIILYEVFALIERSITFWTTRARRAELRQRHSVASQRYPQKRASPVLFDFDLSTIELRK